MSEHNDEVRMPALGIKAREKATRRNRWIAAGIVSGAVLAGGGIAWWVWDRQHQPQREPKAAEKIAAAANAHARDFRNDSTAPPPPPPAAPAPAPAAPPPPPEIPDVGNAAPIDVVSAPRTPAPRPRDPRDGPLIVQSRGNGSALGQDAPAMPGAARPGDDLEATRQDVSRYKQQVGQMIQQLQARQQGGMMPTALPLGAAPAVPQPPQGASVAAPEQPAAQQPPSSTREVYAGQLANPALTLARGTFFPCDLRVRVISSVAGEASCIVPRHVYSTDKSTLLIEAGTQVEGEYRVVNIRPGETRIPVLWTRLRTPNHITVDLDSPATGALGEAGITGTVENRWAERIGASLLLSLVDDAVKIVIADKQADATGGGTNVVLGGTAQTGSRLAEKVLDATINIPPRITVGQGSTVGIYVRHDVRFDNVYALRPTPGR